MRINGKVDHCKRRTDIIKWMLIDDRSDTGINNTALLQLSINTLIINAPSSPV